MRASYRTCARLNCLVVPDLPLCAMPCRKRRARCSSRSPSFTKVRTPTCGAWCTWLSRTSALGSDEVIIITSSLMKDMNSKTDLYRSNAIRVLCSITDAQLLGQIERYLKQARSIATAPMCSLQRCPLRSTICSICDKELDVVHEHALLTFQVLNRVLPGCSTDRATYDCAVWMFRAVGRVFIAVGLDCKKSCGATGGG